MVTGLQLALKEFFPDGSAAKSHSRDSETIQGLTFGGILRAKEKQLQDAQTVSASSIAAAVAAMQALPILQSVTAASVNQVFTETQTVDAEDRSTREVETPEAPLHQPKQSSSTILGVGLSQDTSQIFIETGTPAPVLATGTGMDTGKVMASPEAGRKAGGVGRNESLGSTTPTVRKVTLSAAVVPVNGEVSPVTDTGSSETEKVLRQSASKIEVTQVTTLQPVANSSLEAGAVSTDDVPVHSAAYSETTKTTSNSLKGATRLSQQGTNQEKTIAVTQMTGMQASENSRPVAALRLTPESSVKVSPDESTDSGPRKFTGQTVSQAEVSAFRPAQSEPNLAPQKVDSGTKVGVTGSKSIEPKAAKEAHPIGGVSTGLNLGDEIKSVPLQSETTDSASIQNPPQIPLDRPAKSTGKAGFEPDTAERQIHAASLLPDVPQPAMKTEMPVVLPVQDLTKIERGQNVTPSEKTNADVKQIGEQAAPVMDVLQTETDSSEIEVLVAEKVSIDTGINSETRQAMPPVVQEEAATMKSARPVPEMQAMPVESSPKSPVGNTKVIETQSKVNAPADGTPQATASMIEQAQDVQTVEVSPKPNSQSVISANDAGKFEHARTTSEVTTDAMENSPNPLQPATQEAAQPFVTPDKAGKFQSRQAAVESSLTEPANGKIHPAEKQQGTNPGIETVAAQTPQARGNQVETVAGTGSGMEAKIRTAEVVQQIVHHVEARIHNRSTAMHLQLNPKELGVIDVQMVSGPQGVSVTFSAEQPATGRLLETQLSQLHQSLTDAGVHISGLNIGQHGQPRQEGGFLNQNPQFAQATHHNASRKEADMQEPRHPARVAGQTGEVDYLI